MTTLRFEIALLAALATIFLAFFLWQTPSLWRAPLSAAEIDRYAAEMETSLALVPEERAAFVERVRAWASHDDGRPVALVNLMRFRDRLGSLPPGTDFTGTPEQANAHYERMVVPLALAQGEAPLVGGATQARSLTPVDGASDAWDRVVVMRAPSRRAFLAFMADPAYGPAAPYKLAAAELALIPIETELLVPDVRWLVGSLLLTLYLAIGWLRAARRNRAVPAVSTEAAR